MNTYVIRPRKDRRGFMLTGPLLPYPLWYRRADHAADYVRDHLARYQAGELVTFDEHGAEIARDRIEEKA